MSDQPREVEIKIQWPDASSVAPQFVNQFAVQLGGNAGQPGHQVPDGVYLSIGVIAPPILSGTPEQIHRTITNMANGIEVRSVASLVFSRERAVELRDLLHTVIQQFDASVASHGWKVAADEVPNG